MKIWFVFVFLEKYIAGNIPETLIVERTIENHVNFWNHSNNFISGFRA